MHRRPLAPCSRLGLALAWALACRPTAGDTTSPEPTTSDDASGIPGAIRAIVDAPDRDPADREADARRKPAELLAFLALQPGARVADIGAGFGYTTELLARAVGPTGKVWGQNPEFVRTNFAEAAWTARLAKPVNANVVRVDREFVDPLPPGVRDLDMVVNVLFYHDFEWMGVDRAAHNLAVRNALRPGGHYVIVDAHAKAGAGASVSQSLHRIEESLVIAELRAAGFELVARGEFLRNPGDARDWNALPWQNDTGEFSDKFVLKFRKTGPAAATTCTLVHDPAAARARDWAEAYALVGQRLGSSAPTVDAARRALCDDVPCPTGVPAAVVVRDDPSEPTWTSGGFVLADAAGVRVWSERVGDVREYRCGPAVTTSTDRVGAFDRARLVLLRHQVIGTSGEGARCEVDVDRGCMIGCFYDQQHEVNLLHAPDSGVVVLVEATTPLTAATEGRPPLALVADGGGVRIDGCDGGPVRIGA